MCSYLQIVLILNCCRRLVGAGTSCARTFRRKTCLASSLRQMPSPSCAGNLANTSGPRDKKIQKPVKTNTNIKQNKYIQNMSGFLSLPDAITFLCGEFSKHIWTQRQENTKASTNKYKYKTRQIHTKLVWLPLSGPKDKKIQ